MYAERAMTETFPLEALPEVPSSYIETVVFVSDVRTSLRLHQDPRVARTIPGGSFHPPALLKVTAKKIGQ